MSRIEWLGVLVTGALPLVVLAGLVRRDRLRRCWMFPAYLASVAACNLAVATWPERLFTWSTWLAADGRRLAPAGEPVEPAVTRGPPGLR